MKKSLSRLRLARLNSFTLVELLVVIGIIAILAGVLLFAGGQALKAAQRAKAFNTASQIQSACLNYYTEYSLYPSPPAATPTDYKITDKTADAVSWQTLICVLCGNVHPSTGLPFTIAGATITNSRGIPFLSMKASDVTITGTTDVPKNPIPTGTQIYFNIAMDTDYDGVLGIAPSAVTILPNFGASPFNAAAAAGGGTTTAGVAVWANCTGNTPMVIYNAGYWPHTY